MRYLKPGTYIITKYSKPVWEVTVKPYEQKTSTNEQDFFKKTFKGEITKEFSKR